MTGNSAREEFERSVAHSYAAYRYFSKCVPRPERFAQSGPVRIGGFEFSSPSQAESMRVELGWAFFTRLEAAFEAFWTRLGQKKWAEVFDLLSASGEFSEDELKGLASARELRNVIHHGDGDSSLLNRLPQHVIPKPGHEPHLDDELMDRFVRLFQKAADVLTRPRLRVV